MHTKGQRCSVNGGRLKQFPSFTAMHLQRKGTCGKKKGRTDRNGKPVWEIERSVQSGLKRWFAGGVDFAERNETQTKDKKM